MAGGIELGAAYISILPETSKIAPGVRKALGDAASGSGGADKQGSRIGGFLVKGLKKATKAGLAGGALFAGIAAKKGIDRLLGIEDARASLSGLGHDAKSVDAIMGNALDSVRGTAFGMADAGKAAASAVAAGVKPGKDLERTLKLVADASTIAGTDMGSMGAIFNKVAASNKMQMDVVNQLHDAGVPALQLVAKEMGVTAEEASRMASAGKVDFDTFRNAMESGLGGAAQESGKTTRGAWANMWASIGRVSANLMSGLFPKLREAFAGITEWLGPIEEKSAEWGATLGDLASKYGPPVIGFIRDFASIIGGALGAIGSIVKTLWQYKDVLIVLAAGLLAYKVATTAVAAAEWATYLWQSRSVIMGAARIAITKAMTVAQMGLNKAMRANPIGLVITAITLLIAGAVLAYKRIGWFRDGVNKAWSVIKKGALAAWDAIKGALKSAWEAIRPIFEKLRDVLARVLPPVIKVLSTVFTVAFKAISTYLKIWWVAVRVVFALLVGFIRTVLAPVIRFLWANVVKPVFGFIGNRIKSVWNTLIKPVFNAWKAVLNNVVIPAIRFLWNKVVKPVFGFIGERIGGVWRRVIKPAFDAMRKGVGLVAEGFRRARDTIRDAWNKIKGHAKKPIVWVVNSVVNPFVGGLNKFLPKKWKLSKISGFAAGGWTGPGGKYDPAGIVHADEFVVSKAARRKFERNHPGLLDEINKTGVIPPDYGYAKGGLVKPLKTLRQTSPFGMRGGRLHAGIDFGAPTGTPIFAAKGGTVAMAGRASGYGNLISISHGGGFSTRYAHMYDNGVLTRRGRQVSAGQKIGKVGSFGRSTGPHLHFETRVNGRAVNPAPYLGGAKTPSGSDGPGAFDIVGKLINRWFVKRMSGAQGGLIQAGALKDIFKDLAGGVKSWVKDKIFDEGGLAKGQGVLFKDTPRPERVLSPRQTEAFEKALSSGFSDASASGRMHLTITNWDEGRGYIERSADRRIKSSSSLQAQHRRQYS